MFVVGSSHSSCSMIFETDNCKIPKLTSTISLTVVDTILGKQFLQLIKFFTTKLPP